MHLDKKLIAIIVSSALMGGIIGGGIGGAIGSFAGHDDRRGRQGVCDPQSDERHARQGVSGHRRRHSSGRPASDFTRAENARRIRGVHELRTRAHQS